MLSPTWLDRPAKKSRAEKHESEAKSAFWFWPGVKREPSELRFEQHNFVINDAQEKSQSRGLHAGALASDEKV